MPIKNNKIYKVRKPLTAKERFVLYSIEGFCLLIGFISMLSCIEIDEMDNNMHGTTLFVIFSVIGLLFAILIKLLLVKAFPVIAFRERKNSTLINGGLLGLMILLPALANYYNRTHISSVHVCRDYTVIRKANSPYPFFHKSNMRWTEYWLYINLQGNEERLTVDKSIWDSINENGQVNICLAQGGLGFEIVTQINHFAI